MRMDKRDDDTALDALFDAGRKAGPKPDDAFMARLAADAEAALPRPARASQVPLRRGAGWLTGLFTASGLSGAALVGLWIGFAMPDAFDTWTLSADNSVALSTFLPGADLGDAFDE